MKSHKSKAPICTLFILVFLSFSNCRYRDNSGMHLLSVKQRLCKTWILKEAINASNGDDLISHDHEIFNNELKIESVEKNMLLVSALPNVPIPFVFKDHKTKLILSSENQNVQLKITKLTKTDLWLEGNTVSSMVNSTASSNEIIKLKYHAK